MAEEFKLVVPQIIPPLDTDFRPAVLANRTFREAVARSGSGIPLVLALERSGGAVSRFETQVFAPGHPGAAANFAYVERLVKFLIWQRGGWKLYVGGASDIAGDLARVYSSSGARRFDYEFMSDIYERDFTVVACSLAEVPAAQEQEEAIGRHLEGYRIGFDLGASDRKVSAVVDGEAIYSEEVIWEPRENANPQYHYAEIMKSLKSAAAKMPRVDAIGGSAAGIYVNNRAMVASLFRGVPKERYQEVHNLFPRLIAEWDVPFVVVNDGDVTALAGAMSLEDNGVLGIAMGSSEASGYVNLAGNIVGWLNELSFAPVDYNPAAPVEEWSGDRGCGATYFSQQCVFRLAPKVGIIIPGDVTDAEKLKIVQSRLEAGHEGALKIWQTIGVYLGYALAHYAEFYAVKHILVLGRCTSGQGGSIIVDEANRVLQTEFPELAGRIQVHLPDEKSRRVGQSIAAASLPVLKTHIGG